MALGAAAALAIPLESQDRPNFVVILSDDQSWVGSSVQIDPSDRRTKSDYFRTPNLERLAERGITFTDGYAPAATCCPTRRAIQTGQTPARHIYQADRKGWPATFRMQANIPRVLKGADPRYTTAHFGKWDYRFDRPTPEEMGFDVSDGYTSNGTGRGRGTGGPAAAEDPKLIDHITDRSCDFLTRQAASGQPFYLQVSHYAVHLDIYYRQATLDFVKSWNPGRKHYMPEFAAMTADTDSAIGLLLDKIDDLGLRSRTYVIFLSDNGGRGTLPRAGSPPIPRNHPLRGAKSSLYEGGIRVPFFVAGPGIQAGRVSRTPVTGLDILPTLAELSGHGTSNLPDTVDGGSLAPLLRGESETVDRHEDFLIFHQAADRDPQSALRMGRWKLVKTWASNLLELFDLREDPGERRNLTDKHPETADRLHGLMTGFLAKVGSETRRTEE